MRALLFLIAASTKNRLLARLRRLREPRYAIGTAAGLTYFYALYFRSHDGSGRSFAHEISGGLQGTGLMELAGAALLCAFAVLVWIWPGSRPALLFSRADVQLLFPAPITRRQLVLYRVLKSLVATLGTVGVLTIFILPSGLERALIFFAGTAIAATTINVHMMVVSLTRADQDVEGLAGVRRRWLPAVVVCGLVAIIGVTSWPHTGTPANSRDAARVLEEMASIGLAGVVLWPFRMIVSLPLSGSIGRFLQIVPWTLLLLALNLLWVLRSDRTFEEAAAARAEQVARLRRGAAPVARSGTSRALSMRLAPDGRPEMALAWKNIVLLGRYTSIPRLGAFMLLLALSIGGPLYMATSDAGRVSESLSVVCIGGALTAAFFGPHMVRNDLRRDLAHLSVLKTWPVSSATIVRGELLAPLGVLSMAAWLLIVNAALLANQSLATIGGSSVHGLDLMAAALVIAPAVIAPQLVVLNAIALTFPAWTSVGAGSHGVEVMGQRALLLVATLLALAVAFVPGAVAAGAAGYAQHLIFGTVSILLLAAVASGVVLAECVLAGYALGGLLDRTDLTAVDSGE